MLSDVKSDSDIYESTWQAIKELCVKSKSKSKSDPNHVVNYYEAINAAYLNKTRKLSGEYHLTTIRDYLLDRGIKDEMK